MILNGIFICYWLFYDIFRIHIVTHIEYWHDDMNFSSVHFQCFRADFVTTFFYSFSPLQWQYIKLEHYYLDRTQWSSVATWLYWKKISFLLHSCSNSGVATGSCEHWHIRCCFFLLTSLRSLSVLISQLIAKS